MEGPDIIARTLSRPRPPRTDTGGPRWQYHPRRGFHSEVTCWAMLLDLLCESALLREHVANEKVVFGLDVPLRDYHRDAEKKLDLVIARPEPGALRRRRSRDFRELADHWELDLTAKQRQRLGELPNPVQGRIGQVHLAVEAKAAMTEFGKARPRLYDELNSSHMIMHGASPSALAVGLAMINMSPTFFSPTLNPGLSWDDPNLRISTNAQPRQAELTVAKVMSLPKRGADRRSGYDGLAIILVDTPNDGRPMVVTEQPPAPPPGSAFHYETTIRHVAGEYDTTFSRV